jgi:hypothetical protein
MKEKEGQEAQEKVDSKKNSRLKPQVKGDRRKKEPTVAYLTNGRKQRRLERENGEGKRVIKSRKMEEHKQRIVSVEKGRSIEEEDREREDQRGIESQGSKGERSNGESQGNSGGESQGNSRDRKGENSSGGSRDRVGIKHVHVTQGKLLPPSPALAADTIPGPAYPILPHKSDQKPFKLERIGHHFITQTLADHNGKISKAADALNVSHWTLKKYIDKHTDLKQILNLTKEAEVDFVEKQLLDQIKLGNVTSMIFYLKCHGKERGWVERLKDESEIRKPSVTFKYTLVLPGDRGKAPPKVVAGVETIEAVATPGGKKGRLLLEGVRKESEES